MMNYGNHWDIAGHIQAAPVLPPPYTPQHMPSRLLPAVSAGKIVLLAIANSLISAGMHLKTMAEPKKGYGYSPTEAR